MVNTRPVINKDSLTLALEVFELAAVQRPAENTDHEQHQAGGERDQQIENVHDGACLALARLSCGSDVDQRAARSALAITTSELLAMPRPAAQGGSQPASASGMQAAL